MKRFVLLASALALALFSACEPQQEAPVYGGKQAVPEGQETETTTPEDSTERDARLARLGITPVRCVYFTEYTPSAQFPKEEDIRCFTHINYGHARFVDKKNGTGLEIAKPDYLKKLAAFKKTYPELKILLMVGGWGYNADGFSEMAKDNAKRKAFVENILNACETYGIDGVDLDWEYPTHAAHSTHNGEDYYNGADPNDTKNFNTLVKELREALGENRLITYAASSSGEYMDHKTALEWVDYINVMTYSMGDPPYHNSPLYRSKLTRKRSGEESIETFHSKGVPYDRMNYGVGFYGHGDGSVYPSSVQYHRAVDALSTGKVDGKSVEGYNIRWWDDQGKNCYLGDKDGKMYASYEDPESISYRVAFLKKKGMLGAFAWEYREDDAKGTLRKALRDLMDGKTVENPYPGNGL
jgi:chitinase